MAFVFHVEAGRVREVELIADPQVLATMDVVRTRRNPEMWMPTDPRRSATSTIRQNERKGDS